MPDSPFLANTSIQYAWDSTSLGYLKTCPRLYYYIMIEGWAAKDESVHLRFGIEYHKALEEYDRAKAVGAKHEDAIRQAIRNLLQRTSSWVVDENTKAGKYKNRRSILQLVVDYLDHFRDDAAKTFILDNGRPAVELSFKFDLDWGPKTGQAYMLCGHLDRVVTFNDQLFIMDRKTTTYTISEYYFRQFEPNNQMTIYTLASQIIIGYPMKGIIIDAAQILLEKPNHFERGISYRTPEQLEEFTYDLEYWLNQAEAYATAGYWPMNDTACDKYGGCMFREVCSKSPSTRKVYLKSDFYQLPPEDRWNPLKER